MLDDIARRICDFLRAALEERRPERDAPMAEQTMADFVAALAVEDPSWSQGIEHVARIVAAELQGQTKVWPQAIWLVAIYLDTFEAGVDSMHPRVMKRSDLQPMRRGIPGDIPVKLAVPLVRVLTERATPADRKSLFERCSEWEILSVLIEPLLFLDLSAEEISMLLGHADRFTQGVFNRGQYIDPFLDWAGRNLDIAKDVVERWLRREPGFVELGHSAIDVLVEGGVAHHEESLPWRDDVVDRLSRSRETASWQLAALLACFAWPESSRPPVAQRHIALRKHVERMPERMLATGLRAMARDAGQHPAEAVNAALDLMTLWPREEREPESRARLAAEMCEVATLAAWAIRLRKIEPAGPIPWPSVLDVALDVPPHYAKGLDHLAGEIVTLEPHTVERFLLRWLQEHAGALQADARDLESYLPSLCNRLGQDGMSRLLIRCAVQPDARLRHIAIELMNRGRSTPIDDAFDELSENQARAFAHELVGVGASGDFWIPLVLRLGRMRPGILPELTDMLIEAAVPNHPGVCRKHLDFWALPEECGPESAPSSQTAAALEHARRMLLERLEQLQRVHEQKRMIAELRTTLPAAGYWAEIMNRMMQQSFERQRRFASPFLASIPIQPIARGEATMAGSTGFRVPFGEVSGSFHIPNYASRDRVDPVATALARHVHRQRAAELLSGKPAEAVS